MKGNPKKQVRVGVFVGLCAVVVASWSGVALANMDVSYLWANWSEGAVASTPGNVGHDGNSVWLNVTSNSHLYDRHVQSYELGHVDSDGNIYMTGYPDRFDQLNCWWTSGTYNGNRLTICQYDVLSD